MTRLHTSAPVRLRPATSGPGPRRNEMRGGIPSEGGFHAQSHAKFPFALLPTDANFFDGAPNAHSYRVDRGFGRCVDRGCVGKSDNRPTTIPSRPRKHINIDRAPPRPS